jgi:hypothetical protein
MIRDLIKSHYAWTDCSTSKKRKEKCSTLLKNDVWICKNVNKNRKWFFSSSLLNDHFTENKKSFERTIYDRHYSFDFDWNFLKFLQYETDSKRFRSKHVWFSAHFDHHFDMSMRWKRNQKVSHRDFDTNKIRDRIHARYDWC